MKKIKIIQSVLSGVILLAGFAPNLGAMGWRRNFVKASTLVDDERDDLTLVDNDRDDYSEEDNYLVPTACLAKYKFALNVVDYLSKNKNLWGQLDGTASPAVKRIIRGNALGRPALSPVRLREVVALVLYELIDADDSCFDVTTIASFGVIHEISRRYMPKDEPRVLLTRGPLNQDICNWVGKRICCLLRVEWPEYDLWGFFEWIRLALPEKYPRRSAEYYGDFLKRFARLDSRPSRGGAHS